jgi:hypothetical protein
MKKVQFTLAICLALSLSPEAAAAVEKHGLFEALPENAYDQAPSAGAYETAMTRYEVALDRRSTGDEVAVFFIPVNEDQVWTWRSDGDAVRRLEKGLFRISVGSCLTGFCTEIECRDAGWPTFQCSDGTAREMAAPDFSTMIFGNETYTRMRPLFPGGEPKNGAGGEPSGATEADSGTP